MTTMTTTMAGKRVPVVEDEYFLAKSLAVDLRDFGADVLGPVAPIADALAVITSERLDAVVLDVNLRGEMAYPVADLLIERRVPFVLATGYATRYRRAWPKYRDVTSRWTSAGLSTS